MVAHKSVDSGIFVFNALVATGQMLVSDECTELIEHIPGYMWDQKAAAKGKTEPVKQDDDEVDAWRYAVYTARRFWRDRIPVTPARDDAPGATDDEE